MQQNISRMPSIRHLGLPLLCVLLLAGGSACTHLTQIRPGAPPLLVDAANRENSAAEKFAPAFVIYNPDDSDNRIGRPEAYRDKEGEPAVRVTAENPAFYFLPKEFRTEKGTYENLVYRVHFPRVPFSLVPFILTSGDNVGLMVVVTLNSEGKPVLVTTVHTCGCYVAIIPTSYLPTECLPEGWKNEPASVYGETLPGVLPFQGFEDPVVVAWLRPAVHRVMDLKIMERRDLAGLAGTECRKEAEILPMENLAKLSLENTTVDMFEEKGGRAGYVKGSFKPWETLLMSAFSWNLFIGSDKAYDTDAYGNPFFTSLVPWQRKDSDMWDFARFLKFWGWRL
ncbi:MAG: hypothetical protein AB1921_11160 [Thermodesulfobacteriota bacterium]